MGKDLNGKEIGHGIIQKKNGRYEARYVDRFGKRRSVSGRDLRKVKREYNEALYENDKEINIREKITLDQWYDKWMLLYKIGTIKESSRVRYRDTYKKHISPTLGRYYLTEIQQYQIKELIKNMKDNDLGYEMQNQTKILLVDMFDKAMVNEFVRKNPAKGISVKRDEKKEPRVLSVEEQYDFFECSKGTFYDNFFNVAVTTGMRLGDDDDKIRLNQRKPSKYKGLRRFGPEKNLQRINKFMKERPIFYKNLIQMKENIRFYLRCFYCITKVMILQFNSENRTELARNG